MGGSMSSPTRNCGSTDDRPLTSSQGERLIGATSATIEPAQPSSNLIRAERVTITHTCPFCSPQHFRTGRNHVERPDVNVNSDMGAAGFHKQKLEKDMQKLEIEVLTAEDDAQATRDELEKMINFVKTVNGSKDELEKECRQLHSEFTELDRRYSRRLQECMEREKRCAMLEHELSRANNRIEQTYNSYAVLQEELGQMKLRNKTLTEEVQDLERQRGELVASSGFYDSDSGATPNQLQKLANKLRDLLSSLSKKLMASMRTALQQSNMTVEELGLDFVQGVNLSRKPDVKFAYQKLVADICFQGFEAEDYGILDSLPASLDREQSQSEYFHQFETLNSLSAAQVYNMVESFESKMQACDSKACLDAGCCCCGQDSFLRFFDYKANILKFELGNILNRRGARDDGLWNATVKKDLVQLLTSVWLYHRLSFAFDPPATLFKIRSGHAFDPQYMENVGMMRDNALEDVEQVFKVSFMILPGFRVAKSLIRGQVYVP